MIVREAKLAYQITGKTDLQALSDAEDAYRYLRDSGAFAEHPEQESFIVIPLNRKNRPIKGAWIRVTLGTANASLVHPREVFRPAILAGASALIVAHNHPSGDPSPSTADMRATLKLREAANILGIDLLDHVICGDPSDDPSAKGYYSFSEAGMLP